MVCKIYAYVRKCTRHPKYYSVPMVRISIHGDRCVEYKDFLFRYYLNKRIVRKKSRVRISTKLLILINYYVLKTRVMFPLVTFDGLFLKDAIIQCIYNLLMARRSYLRDILSRGISAYLVNRVECISTPTRYFEMLKCSTL